MCSQCTGRTALLPTSHSNTNSHENQKETGSVNLPQKLAIMFTNSAFTSHTRCWNAFAPTHLRYCHLPLSQCICNPPLSLPCPQGRTRVAQHPRLAIEKITWNVLWNPLVVPTSTVNLWGCRVSRALVSQAFNVWPAAISLVEVNRDWEQFIRLFESVEIGHRFLLHCACFRYAACL